MGLNTWSLAIYMLYITNDQVYSEFACRENDALFAQPTVDSTLIAPDSDDRPTACNATSGYCCFSMVTSAC